MANQYSSGKSPGWRAGGSKSSPGAVPHSDKRRKILTILAVMLALGGSILGLLYWLRPIPEPFFVPLFVTAYEVPQLPVNSMASQDRDAILDCFPRNSQNTKTSQEKQLLEQELSDLKKRKESEPVVLYLCALARGIPSPHPAAQPVAGRAQGEGADDVLVLPANTVPGDLNSGLKLTFVLRQLQECPSRHKLLILDVMKPLDDSYHGIVARDVASRVRATLQAVEDPNRLVLCACSGGQISLVSEELGRSVFNYYLEEGLRGYADGANPGRKLDGHVSVMELAEFVRSKVDRWAKQTRGARQVPVLEGSAKDFHLVGLEHGEPKPHVEIKPSSDYPLVDAWKVMDQAWSDGSYRTAPRAFQQLTANLLRAEQRWQSGFDPVTTESELKEALNTFRRIRDWPLPRPEQPRSLALAARLGQKPDPALTAEMRKMLDLSRSVPAGDAGKAARDAIDPDFKKKFDNKQFEAAWAAFELAANDSSPKPDTLKFLDHLLRLSSPKPQYVETLFLQRLAVLADKPNGWQIDTVRRALDVVRKGEHAASFLRTYPWLGRKLEEAAQRRHDGEFALWERGFVSYKHADNLLTQAGNLYDALIHEQEVLEGAGRCVDETMAILQFYGPYLDAMPQQEDALASAAQTAHELWAFLAIPPDPASGADLTKAIEDCGRKSDGLRRHLDNLRRPFQSENVKRLLAMSEREDAGPAVCTECRALLSCPLLNAADRKALWQANRRIAERLKDAVVNLDQTEDQNRTLPPTPNVAEKDLKGWENAERQRAMRRARLSRGFLQAAGLAPTELAKVDEALQRASKDEAAGRTSEGLDEVSGVLRQAWIDLQHQLEATQEPRLKDRLSRALSPLENSSILDQSESNPTLKVRSRDAADLWGWLADRYGYESKDSPMNDVAGRTLYDDAAREYAKWSETPPPLSVEFKGIPSDLRLARTGQPANCKLEVNIEAPANSQPSVSFDVFQADEEWVQVTADSDELKKLEKQGPPSSSIRTCQVPLRVELKSGAGASGAPRPDGFLVAVRVRGRAFHREVPISQLPPSASERLEILLSTDSKRPTSPVHELSLRPLSNAQDSSGARQAYHVYVFNPSEKLRNVNVELRVDDAALKRVPIKLIPKAATPVAFEGPLPAPGMALPELKGKVLEIRLLDADSKDAPLGEKSFAIAVASPREYVDVSDPLYTPPANGEKNRLSMKLKARTALTPPCQVELVLRDRKSSRVLTPHGGNVRRNLIGEQELKFEVEDIPLDNPADEEALAYLNVDGYERAFCFRVTLARSGGPSKPREQVNQTAIRLQSERYTIPRPDYDVHVEADNVPPGATIKLQLGREAGGAFESDLERTFAEGREQRVGFSPSGPGGALLFESHIKDWSAKLDTSGIRGARELRAQVLNGAGAQILKAPPAEVMFDNTEPEDLKFLAAPRLIKLGEVLTLKASALDPESGIKEVNFFLGKPKNNQPPPDGTIPATSDETGAIWTAKVPMPEKRGPASVTVHFINRAGKPAFKTIEIDVGEPSPTTTESPGQNKNGSIRGTVLEGTRKQPAGLPVTLSDAKGNFKAKTETDDNGAFVFKDLAPGSYIVSATKAASQTKGEVSLSVAGGKEAEAKIMLNR